MELLVALSNGQVIALVILGISLAGALIAAPFAYKHIKQNTRERDEYLHGNGR